MSGFDEGVLLRAYRWYVVPASRTISMAADRPGSGFRTIKAVADDAERLALECEEPTSGRHRPGRTGSCGHP